MRSRTTPPPDPLPTLEWGKGVRRVRSDWQYGERISPARARWTWPRDAARMPGINSDRVARDERARTARSTRSMTARTALLPRGYSVAVRALPRESISDAHRRGAGDGTGAGHPPRGAPPTRSRRHRRRCRGQRAGGLRVPDDAAARRCAADGGGDRGMPVSTSSTMRVSMPYPQLWHAMASRHRSTPAYAVS